MFYIVYSAGLQAKIKLPSFISSGMVLQQKTEILIWGQSNKSTAVTLETSWNGKIYSTQSNEVGDWKIKIPTPKAGGPYQLIISDGEKTILDNVLIGEVWIASGQSNMEMPLRGFSNQKILGGSELISNSENRNIRFFQGDKISKGLPQWDLKGIWQQASPGAMPNFSAVAYYFAYLLQKELKVPIGIVQVAWGGTAIQSWMDSGSLKGFPEVKLPEQKDMTYSNKNTPTGLFNGMINPLIPFKAKGFLWYQG